MGKNELSQSGSNVGVILYNTSEERRNTCSTIIIGIPEMKEAILKCWRIFLEGNEHETLDNKIYSLLIRSQEISLSKDLSQKPALTQT